MRRPAADGGRLADPRARGRRRWSASPCRGSSPARRNCCCSRCAATPRGAASAQLLLDRFVEDARRPRRTPASSRGPRRKSCDQPLQAGRFSLRSGGGGIIIAGADGQLFDALTLAKTMPTVEKSAVTAEFALVKTAKTDHLPHTRGSGKSPWQQSAGFRMAESSELNETLITLTADIVSAHVSNNSVAVNDLPQLIQNVHGALARPRRTAGEAPAPARAGGFDPLVDQARLYRLPRGREEAEDAEAASDDPLSDDPRPISPEMGPHRRLSDGRAQLCRAAPRRWPRRSASAPSAAAPAAAARNQAPAARAPAGGRRRFAPAPFTALGDLR